MAYFSRKLLPREQKYATIEKECLAIKLGMEAFQVYLLGKEFTIQTDHRELKWLTRFKDNNNRLMRWSLSMQPFRFQVQHRKELIMPMLILSLNKLNLTANLREKEGSLQMIQEGRDYITWTQLIWTELIMFIV